MALMCDEILNISDGLPVLTAGEMRMWNFTAKNVDLFSAPDGQWITTSWAHAYRLAVAFLSEMGIDDEVIREILNLDSVPEDSVPLATRWRLYDVHRIRIALLLLYPSQPDIQRHWLTARGKRFANQPPLELMRGSGLRDVRCALEASLNY